MLKKLQQEYDEDVIFVRPGSNRGLIDLLSNHQDAGILVLDDVDHLWGHQQTLSTLKVAFDTRSPLLLRHDLRVKHNASGDRIDDCIEEFEVRCGVIFLSNKNFDDPTQFNKTLYKTAIEPIRYRNNVVNLGFNPLDIYEYVGWIATTGQMLKRITWKNPKGEQRLSRQMSNEVLAHFQRHAAHYPDLSPRGLEIVARHRLGESYEQWLQTVNDNLTPTPKWAELLPGHLGEPRIPLFQI